MGADGNSMTPDLISKIATESGFVVHSVAADGRVTIKCPCGNLEHIVSDGTLTEDMIRAGLKRHLESDKWH